MSLSAKKEKRDELSTVYKLSLGRSTFFVSAGCSIFTAEPKVGPGIGPLYSRYLEFDRLYSKYLELDGFG